MKIRIKHLFPNLLNLYGDKGNLATLKMRCIWRGIDVEIEEVDDSDFSLNDCDLLILGGGYEREQRLVLEKLKSKSEDIKAYIEKGGVMLALCGGFEMLGKFENGDGLGIIDIVTKQEEKRLMGDILLECIIDDQKLEIVGFENHQGRVDIKNHSPFGKVISGCGNNEKDEYEGVIYKNLFATHLHGPLLPKNPSLTDLIITRALKNKYENYEQLPSLDDSFEQEAHDNIMLKLKKE